jgi:hypothetical protein
MAALRQFVEDQRFLPLVGSLPDMKADTERYIALQSMYVLFFEFIFLYLNLNFCLAIVHFL